MAKVQLGTKFVSSSAVQKALRNAAEKFVAELRSAIPISRENRGPFGRSGGGHMKDSLRIREKNLSIEIYSVHPGMKPFLEGSKPHPITPKNKKVLAWPNAKFLAKSGEGQLQLKMERGRKRKAGLGTVGVGTQFVREVDHPGNPPFAPFVKLKEKVPELVKLELKKLL